MLPRVGWGSGLVDLLEHIITLLRLDVVLLVLAAGLVPWLAYLKGRGKRAPD